MKFALVLLCVAVALPAISQAFLFGITLTDAAGVALAAADPTQTGVIVLLGVLGASLAFAGGALASQLLFPAAEEEVVEIDSYGPYKRQGLQQRSNRRRRVKLGAQFRNRRDVSVTEIDINGIMDTIFVDIHKTNMEGCFQRLVCDIAARPAEYPKNVPIVNGVQLIDAEFLTNQASSVSRKLMEALKFGQATTDVNACEATFNKCDWSGPQMDKIISGMGKHVTIEP